MFEFKVKKEIDGEYKATVVTAQPGQAVFGGYGKTLREAVGECLIANREYLGFIFTIDETCNTLTRTCS